MPSPASMKAGAFDVGVGEGDGKLIIDSFIIETIPFEIIT